MVTDSGERVTLADVARLLERVLGIPGDDWRIESYGTPYEGWVAVLRPTCVCDRTACYCCDGMNLTAEDVALIEAALSGRKDLPHAHE